MVVSVCLSVGYICEIVSPAKLAELIEMQFCWMTGGPRELCIRWESKFFEGTAICGLYSPLKSIVTATVYAAKKNNNGGNATAAVDYIAPNCPMSN